MVLFNLFFLVVFVQTCAAFRILLFFSVPTKSHSLLGEGYVRHLLDAGHNITYISPVKLDIQSSNLRQIDVSENIKWYPSDQMFNVQKIIRKESNLIEYIPAFFSQYIFTKNTLLMKSVQDLLMDTNENFDAVVVEWAYNDLGSGLATVFNCPLIWSSSHTPHTLVLSLIDDHLNPAYTFHGHSKCRSFTFTERVRQLWDVMQVRLYMWSHKREHDAMYRKVFEPAISKRGLNVPFYEEVRYNASLVLGNGNIVSSDPVALPKSYKDIGGYHIFNTNKKLPQNFQEIMDNATNGAIYFSLGSILKVSSMTKKLQYAILHILNNTNRTVIWNSDVTFSTKSDNVHTFNWVPQLNMLDHPNCVLFITHAGLLSITESLYYGVPVIGIPFFADQYNNINKVADLGYGKQAFVDVDAAGNLEEVITEVLMNKTYLLKAKELSKTYRHRLASPGLELVYWIEHVINSRGAQHLKSNSLNVEWYKKQYLDLLAAIILLLFVIMTIIKSVFSVQKLIDVKIKTKVT